MRLLFVGELGTARNAVPFFEATAAAGARSVLSDEDRMPAPRRLLAVVRGIRRPQSRGDEIAGVHEHGRHSLLAQIRPLVRAETKLAAKRRRGEPREYLV